jgi:Zn-dependent protease
MNKYFQLDSRKVTYGEYWNIVRSWKVIIPWTCKLLNIRMNFMSALPYFESVRELEVPEEEFSGRAREKLNPLLEECRKLGFNTPVFFTYESMHRDVQTSGIALMHSSSATIRLTHTLGFKVNPPKEDVRIFLLSQLRDGTFLATSSQRQQFLNPPAVIINRLVNAPLEKLIELHLRSLAELPMNNPVKGVTTADSLNEIWDQYEKLSRDFGMQRGIYVWMTPEGTAAQQQTLTEAKTTAENEEDVGVLLELNQLQNQKSSWAGMIVLFAVSLVLFIGAGAGRWSISYLVILLGVLFVHELGHYLAMRAFNYKNVKMFFIPFFGAAVSGQHYNVPGWKKVLVSLMGPVPGIVLGVILGGIGLLLHKPILVKIALVSMLLNGFNLLPVLPLDGGWVFHALLFSRHYMLDTVFRVFAALALIASPLVLHTRILPYVGILMLITVPVTYRTARIAAALKKEGLPPVSDDNQQIPPATAQVIISEVKKSTPRPQSNKTIAQQVLQIFEMLNAKPPGWSASIGLLFIQIVSIGMAVVFGLAFYVAQTGSLSSFFNAVATGPKHKLSMEQLRSWNISSSMTASDQAGIILVATFGDTRIAKTEFESLTNRLPDTASLNLFGESLMLALPDNQDDLRKQWLGELSGRTKDTFVDSTNYHAAFSLLCIAPDTNTAEGLVEGINSYFDTFPDEALVPPWLPQDTRSPEQHALDDLARQTYTKLLGLQFPNDDELDNLENKKQVALKEGDEASASELQQQITALSEKIRKQNIAQVRSGADGPVDTNVVDWFVALNAPEVITNQISSEKIRKLLARHMGQLANATNSTTSYYNRYSAVSGTAMRAGLLINISFVSFNRIDNGPQAMAAWLLGKGCIGFKYDFFPGMGNLGIGDDE